MKKSLALSEVGSCNELLHVFEDLATIVRNILDGAFRYAFDYCLFEFTTSDCVNVHHVLFDVCEEVFYCVDLHRQFLSIVFLLGGVDLVVNSVSVFVLEIHQRVFLVEFLRVRLDQQEPIMACDLNIVNTF